MFGNVPRVLWQKWCPPDDLGRIFLQCRAFLVEDGSRKILIETGVGAFFEPRLRERFGVQEERHLLLDSLRALGVDPEDIDVVLLSHLHFDHAGGLLSVYEADAPRQLVFPRAQFVVGQLALERATTPHPRDRASFIPELLTLLTASGRLQVVPEEATHHRALGERVRLFTSFGHTPGMLVPTLLGSARSATFCADLVPGSAWVHLPITMGYDRFPERLIDEKRLLYERLGDGAWLLFTHDPDLAAGQLGKDERERYCLSSTHASLLRWDLDAPS